MRFLRILGLFAVLLIALAPQAYAADMDAVQDELFQESGVNALIRALPEETQNMLRSAGVSPERMAETDGETVFGIVSAAVQTEFRAPLRTLLLLIAVVVLCCIVREYAPDSMRLTVNLCGAVSTAVLLLPKITDLIGSAGTVVNTAGVFLAAAVPVYAGLMISSGNVAAGSSYGALTLTAANGVTALSAAFLMPLLRVFLAVSAVSAVTTFDLKKLTDGLYRAVKWILILAVTIFSGVLTIQTVISSQTDIVANRTAKLIASSAVPIVGSAFGDAIAAITGSVSLVKSSAGAFGLLASLAVFLPVCARVVLWLAVCLAASFSAELFELRKLSSFLEGCATAIKLLLAVLISVGVVSVVSAAVVLCVRGAYA